ncbi:MAG: flagellar biosynthetic protein FliO [Terriglobales bacterium]
MPPWTGSAGALAGAASEPPPGAAASFHAQLAQAVERSTPGAGTAGPWAPPAATLDPAAGWKRLLPACWGRFWPALRRGAAQATRRPRRELRMAEMLTLSEKRFLAVVRYGETQFLIGGAQNSIALLSRIEPPPAPTGHPIMFR